MAETNSTNIKPRKVYGARWICVYSILIAVIIILTWFFIIRFSNQQSISNYPVSRTKQVNNPLRNIKGDSIKISEETLDKFNDHIDFLTEKVQSEVDRSQKNNEYDIDRLNTFLAIGIGLLAIIGGLLPLVINFFSKEQLESKIETCSQNIEMARGDSITAKNDAAKAKSDSEQAMGIISAYEGRIEEVKKNIQSVNDQLGPIDESLIKTKKDVENATKKIPYIDLLMLQNSIARLVSVSSIRYYSMPGSSKNLADIFASVVSAFNQFPEDQFSAFTKENISYFLDNITELKVGLQFSPFRYRLNRSFNTAIDDLGELLEKFTAGNIDQYKSLVELVVIKLTAIVANINNQKR